MMALCATKASFCLVSSAITGRSSSILALTEFIFYALEFMAFSILVLVLAKLKI